ncbi:hypothetical protein [Terrabacter sp. C0L_2]|jgi:hypothetical protein|uniref:hypothetical protein n=1 Tax=Terrabacter sp. C0L_2 TaxID=3108389 RepID=UPI002ED0E592|nr:hypothetical protein U5C87_06785 [Terrabacter sp. C0L_2]
MAFADLTIPGVSGTVSTDFSFWSGYRFTVDGRQVKPHGFPRNRLTLPGASGSVEAKIKGGLARAHPALVVGGTEYATGPDTPRLQQVLALLPMLTLLLVQGAIGFAVAFGGTAVNMGIVRGEQRDSVKVALMIGTLVAAVAVDLAAVMALDAALGA